MGVGYETKGKYAVGTFCYTVVDEEREDELGGGGHKRRMAVRMYYPVLRESVIDLDRAILLSEIKQTAIRKTFHLSKKMTIPSENDCYENAEVVKNEKFPLVLFSHGYQGYIEQNSVLCCDLASEGYIVASIGHAYEAVVNEYGNGDCDYYDKSLNKKLMSPIIPLLIASKKLLKRELSVEESKVAFQAFQDKYGKGMLKRTQVWIDDSIAVINDLEEKNEMEKFPLYHAIDFTNGIAATGHSFGGATAYNLCLRDSRLACGINMDGALYGENKELVLNKPFMILGCKENRNVEICALADTKAPIYYIAFDLMKHMGFSDAKYYLKIDKYIGRQAPQKVRKEILDCHVRFLNRYLKKQENVVMVKNDDVIDVMALNDTNKPDNE